MTTFASTAPTARRPWLAIVPLALLVAGAVLANLGMSVTSDATAATSNVTVSAEVASNVTLNACATSFAVPDSGGFLAMGVYNKGTCQIKYSASNNSALPLTVADNAGTGAFFATNPSAIAEKAAGCSALTVANTLGIKTSTPTLGTGEVAAASDLCGTTTDADTLSTSARFSEVPPTATKICTTTSTSTHVCAVTIGILTGASATAGKNTGQLNFAAS